ncbi:hypothetical protein BX070DRAFT_6856 [Coemansia spiralis]|nr:hypothetical protein BX070DRAFT_6856 [Coemansia spiralis]
MSTSPRSALPSNRYVQRTAVKEGTCFICGYSTATLLVTEQSSTKDWFYVCMIHTFIPDFCTAIDEGVAADTGASETSKTTTSALPSTLQGSNKMQKHKSIVWIKQLTIQKLKWIHLPKSQQTKKAILIAKMELLLQGLPLLVLPAPARRLNLPLLRLERKYMYCIETTFIFGKGRL